jgi:hypothetical protein
MLIPNDNECRATLGETAFLVFLLVLFFLTFFVDGGPR